MKSFFAILFLLPGLLSAQQKFVVSGNITGLPEGSTVTMSNLNKPDDTLSRAEVKEGKFQLAGIVDEPNLFQLNFDGVKKKSVLFIGNDNVVLEGNTDNIQDIVVKGSTVHDAFEEF